MAFRKLDLKERLCVFAPGSFAFENEEISVNPIQKGNNMIHFVAVKHLKSSEIAKQTLDPQIVTLENMIEAGVTLDPGYAARMLNITDSADLEDRSAVMSENLYKTLLENDFLKREEE